MDWHFDIDHFVFFQTLRRLLNVTPMASKKMRANHFRWTHPLISKLFPSVYFCWTTKSNAEDSSKNHSDRACFVIYCMRMNSLRFKVLRCLRLHIGGALYSALPLYSSQMMQPASMIDLLYLAKGRGALWSQSKVNGVFPELPFWIWYERHSSSFKRALFL